MEKEVKYYISTGRDNKMYTLRETWKEPVYKMNNLTGKAMLMDYKTNDNFVVTLNGSKESSIEKAQKYMQENNLDLSLLNTEIQVDADPIAEKTKLDHSKMEFGKYKDQPVFEVHKEDPDYVSWYFSQIINQPSRQAHAKFVADIVGISLEEKKEEMKKALEEEEARQKEWEAKAEEAKKHSTHLGQVGDVYKSIPVMLKSTGSFNREAWDGSGMELVFIYNFYIIQYLLR